MRPSTRTAGSTSGNSDEIRDIEAEFLRYAAAIERDPVSRRGHWREGFDAVFLDCGSGMGDYLVECAVREPRSLFIGIEKEAFCVVKAARKACERGLESTKFIKGDIAVLPDIFAPAELSGIFINFPTPYARRVDAAKRMTSIDMLVTYRNLLAPDGFLRLKTDSKPFFDFSLDQLSRAGYELSWQSDDLHGFMPDDPITGYEARLVGEGATVFAFEAMPGDAPLDVAQTERLSLFDYLPEDLSTMTYIPTDMRRSVENMIESRTKVERRREEREARKLR